MALQRCRSRADFAAFARARRHRGDHLWLRFATASDVKVPRVGLAIGRNVGSAVVRNRLRRQLWAALREIAPTMRAGRYLIGARTAAAGIRFAALRDELRELTARATANTERDASVRRASR